MGSLATGRVSLFGHQPTSASMVLVARTARWRGLRAFLSAAGGFALAPIVGLVPPHVPWALGVIGVGLFLARRRLREHHTLISVEVMCPRCGAELSIPKPTALRTPHTLTCDTCHYEPVLRLLP